MRKLAVYSSRQHPEESWVPFLGFDGIVDEQLPFPLDPHHRADDDER
jgi:hypothetical protein